MTTTIVVSGSTHALGVVRGLGRKGVPVVVVSYADGTQRSFTVVERRLIAKPELPVEEVFARSGPPALVLITCGGEFDRSIRRYRSNVVVTAWPTT